MRVQLSVVAIVVLLLPLVAPAVAYATPPLPFSPYGTVLVDAPSGGPSGGVPAPAGTVVSAWCGGVKYKETTTQTSGGDSWYFNLDIPGDDPETPGKDGCSANETVTFRIGLLAAAPSAPWTSTSYQLDLRAATATATPSATLRTSATRTPTPTRKVTATRTPTRTPTMKATRTPTRTPTKKATRTPTRSTSITPTRTPTKKPTATRTPTRATSITPTRTPTKKPTATRTPTKKPTATRTPTRTAGAVSISRLEASAASTDYPRVVAFKDLSNASCRLLDNTPHLIGARGGDRSQRPITLAGIFRQ